MTFHQKPMLGMQLNRRHKLVKSLAACWVMNEGAGGKIFDPTGHGNIGTLVGGNWEHNGLYLVSGSNEYVNLGVLGDFGSKMENEYSFFVKFKSSQSTNIGMFGTYDAGKTTTFIAVNESPDGTDNQPGHIRVYSTPIGSTTDLVEGGVDADTGITDGGVHTLFVNFKPLSNTLEIWVDGISQTISYNHQTMEGNENFNNFEQNLYLGAINVDGAIASPMTGTIYSSYLFEGARTESEVISLHREPYAMFLQPISPALLYYEAPTGVTIPVLMHHYNQMMGA